MEGHLTDGNNELCARNFLLISRSAVGQPRCVALSINNLVQFPNVITNQSVIFLGARGQDRPVPGMHEELASDSLPPLEIAFNILQDAGYITKTDGGKLYKELYIDVHTRSIFIELGPTDFVLAIDIILPGSDPDIHFEAVILKEDVYWLLLGVSNAKVLRLGSLEETANILFTQRGRYALLSLLRREYVRSGDHELQLQWGNTRSLPFLIVPRMSLPAGRSKSVWDTFSSTDEVKQVLQPDMSIKRDRSVTKNARFAVQIIDLDNSTDVETHTVAVHYNDNPQGGVN